MNEKEAGKRVRLKDESGSMRETKQVLYADDTVLMTETREDLQHTESEFERACDRMKLKINVDMSEARMIRKDQRANTEKVKCKLDVNDRGVKYR